MTSSSTGQKVYKGLNRNLLILGAAALLTLGGIAIHIAMKKDGDIHNTVTNANYEEIQNTYFSQIIVNGATTKENLEQIQGIRPYGTLFIGISKDALTLSEAQDLARHTGSDILNYATDQPRKTCQVIKLVRA